MTRAWLSLSLLAACGGRPSTMPAQPEVPCVDRFLGQVMSESIAVAATPDAVFWLDYNFGRLEGRDRVGGPVVTLARPRTEQNSEELLVAGTHLVWDSKADRAVYSRPIAAPPGTAAERLLTIDGDDDFPVGLAVAGDVVYAQTFGGSLAWWRGGQTGARRMPATAMVAHAGALYLGGDGAIRRLATPDGEAVTVTDVDGEVVDLAVAGDDLYWIVRDEQASRLVRWPLAGGAPEVLATMEPYALGSLAVGLDGVFAATSNVLLLAPAGGDSARPVAHAPADLVDLAVSGRSVFVGTSAGSVHELCITPERTLTLEAPQAPLECPDGLSHQRLGLREVCTDAEGRWAGPSREWYASGHLKTQISDTGVDARHESFYADGTPSYVYSGEGAAQVTRTYYVTGQLAGEGLGDAWKSYQLDGTPVAD